jgi:hypothetical protein
MIYYLNWRNCLVTAAYNYFKIVWDCQQILVRCSPIKSTQLVACSSILKFNQQKHTDPAGYIQPYGSNINTGYNATGGSSVGIATRN